MSKWIRLSNSRGRDARVRMESKQATIGVCYQTEAGHPVSPQRIIKAPLEKSYSHLLSHCPNEKELARYLRDADPEIDLEAAGRFTGHTDRVLLDANNNVVYGSSEVEVLFDRYGCEVERREPLDTQANIDTESPLVWTGKMFSRTEVVRRFVLSRKYQLRHIDGLTFDFLLSIAQELDKADSLVLIGAGAGGAEPLLLERNGLPYRGFLEGRINGERYLLILHLSQLELRSWEAGAE